MSAIIDFLNKVLGKQDETLTAVGSIAKDFDALKASASEKDAKITALQSRVDELAASLALETGKSQKLEAEAANHAAALEAKSAEVDKLAAAKALEITAKQGQPPINLGAAPVNPAEPKEKNLSHLKGLARVAAAINRDLGITNK